MVIQNDNASVKGILKARIGSSPMPRGDFDKGTEAYQEAIAIDNTEIVQPTTGLKLRGRAVQVKTGDCLLRLLTLYQVISHYVYVLRGVPKPVRTRLQQKRG